MSYACLCYSVLFRILYYPLTKPCLLCYNIHEDKRLSRYVFFVVINIITFLRLFVFFFVTYLLYHNNNLRTLIIICKTIIFIIYMYLTLLIMNPFMSHQVVHLSLKKVASYFTICGWLLHKKATFFVHFALKM